jgi:hypothetical protein
MPVNLMYASVLSVWEDGCYNKWSLKVYSQMSELRGSLVMRSIEPLVTLKALCWGLLLFVALPNAHAVPSYARQTGQQCVACHVSFPELTPYGRYFKLTGYTIGERQMFPVAVMAQASYNSVAKNDDGTGTGGLAINNRNNDAVFSAASLFVAGKATDYLGGFIQWTYNNVSSSTDPTTGITSLKGHSGLDNSDVRLVGKYTGSGSQEPDLIYGLTVHNNPTVQDVWNSTSAFGFPYTASPFAINPAAKTQVDNTLAQQVAGLGGYLFWKKSLYAELSLYRTADGAFSLFRAGQDTTTPGAVARLNAYNPYWRLAWNHEWGPNSVMVGTYGLRVNRLPDNTIAGTPTDQYTDYAVDAQFQSISGIHTYTAQAAYIWEKQDYKASFPAGGIGAGPVPTNATDNLRTFKVKGTYYYQRKYGATVAYFNTTGTADAGLYTNGAPIGGSLSGSPNSNGYIFELNYLPIQNVRLMLQYTLYQKFNGDSTNYDGFGRNAHDNNLLFANLWIAF